MKAITSERCCGSSLIFGMIGCDVSSDAFSAIAVIPLTAAMALNGGAAGFGDLSPLRTPWQPAHVSNATIEPRFASPGSCVRPGTLPTAIIVVAIRATDNLRFIGDGWFMTFALEQG